MGTKKTRPKKRGSPSTRLAPDFAEAALGGRLSDLREFLRAGAEVNAADRQGFTPLMLSIMGGDFKKAVYLTENGADVNRRNQAGQTALMLAAQMGKKELVTELIRAGADVNARDNEKRSAVFWATIRGDFPDLISTLLVFKADPDTKDIRGMTPLMAAALMGYANSVAVLLTVGADEKAKFRGRTAYQMAAEKRHTEVCRTIKAVLANRPRSGGLGG